MSRNIAASNGSCPVECMEPGRAQLEAQNPTITNSEASLSIVISISENTNEDSTPPSLKNIRNDRGRDTHTDFNEMACKIADINLDRSDAVVRKKPSDIANTTVEYSNQNTDSEDSERGIGSGTPSIPTIGSPPPVIVVSTKGSSSPPIEERQQPVPVMFDEPDPRLVDALRKPLDRPLILRLEQEVITFITGELDSYDTSPLNSYHRMLVHKIAEFYRLTHIVSPEANDCVRLFRGHAARIPPVKLSEIATSKSPPSTPPLGPQLAVKIMRRKSPSQRGANGDSDQAGNGMGNGVSFTNDPSKPMSREEREAAYQLARARIFGDFKASPPETPSPSRNSNEKHSSQGSNKEHVDEFQSRSQYYPIAQSFPVSENSGSRLASISPAVPGLLESGPITHILNPAAVSFDPNAGTFIPNRQAATQPVLNQHPVAWPQSSIYPAYPPSIIPDTPFTTNQPNHNRLMSSHTFDISSMTRLPPGPQVGHGNSTPMNHRFPPLIPGFVPPVHDGIRGYNQFSRIPDQNLGFGVSYPINRLYSGYRNGNNSANLNGNIERSMNGDGSMNEGWPVVNAGSIQQQGRFQPGARSLTHGHTGNIGPFGAGRG